MNTMPLFSELEKLGYKKHSEKSFEELDELPFDSIERTIEQSLVYKWLRDFYKIYCPIDPNYIDPNYNANNKGFKNNIVFVYSVYVDDNNINAGYGLSYEEAEYKSMIEVINVLKNKL
jgi:dsRNA-specific ribonuclease